MGESVGRSMVASGREAGAGCPHCDADVEIGDPVIVCQACGTVHHPSCWERRGGCGSYHCAPSRRPEVAASRTEPVLLITAADLDRATPIAGVGVAQRADVGAARPGPGRPALGRVKTSRLAVASLICAIAGIPLFGLLTGLVAALLGILALGAIHSGARRGLGLALPGLLLGVADVAGWAYLLSTIPWQAMVEDRMFSDPPPDLESIRELDPPLQRAMRANVLIERRHGLGVLGGKAIGSGVVLRIEGGDALIVTNRHVVDAKFPADYDGSPGPLARVDRPGVRMLGQPDTQGEVVWMAPGEIDLALVRAPASASSGAQAAPWQRGRPMRVGRPVFAIGNPHNLGWTHTQGVISQLRTRTYGARRIRVIQTQAAINPGNSGGGLYDEEGYCLGINTWTADKSVSEGLGFAVALDALLDLAPPPLANAMEEEGPTRPRKDGGDGPGPPDRNLR